MSKCREEFEKHFGDDAFLPSLESWHCWKDAWNARGKVDAEICRSHAERHAKIAPRNSILPKRALQSCAEAIEQENEK